MDYDEDEEIDGGFAAEEITKLSDGVPVELWTANMLDFVYKNKYILLLTYVKNYQKKKLLFF